MAHQRITNEDQPLAEDFVEVPIHSSDEEIHRGLGNDHFHERNITEEDEDEGEGSCDEIIEDVDENGTVKKKKDKKLVFLSRSVLEKIKERPMTTGTQIANEILELYKRFSAVFNFIYSPYMQKVDFKNVQRRVYDALNVLNAMDIIKKDRNHIFYNPNNTIIPPDSNTYYSKKYEPKNYIQNASQLQTEDEMQQLK